MSQLSSEPQLNADAIERALDRLDLAAKPCDYCDVRVETVHKTQIVCLDGEVSSVVQVPSTGAFVRVHARGRWHGLATTDLDALDGAIDRLIQDARALPPLDGEAPIPFDGLPVLQDRRPLHFDRLATAIPLSEKRALCERMLAVLVDAPGMARHELQYADALVEKHFASSRGTRVSYGLQRFGTRVAYTLVAGDERFEDYSRTFGTEFAQLANAPTVLAEDVAESHVFVDAPAITPGTYRMVLAPSVVGVFAHESFGHKSEADFMVGDAEAIAQWPLGQRVGSDVLSIVDDGTTIGTSGDCPFDDEGMPAQKTYLIQQGILSGRLHSQRTAAAFGEAVTGNGRAMDFEFEPMVRMTSTYVEPGEPSVDELFQRAGDGLYIKTTRGGTGMSTFTIAPRKVYRIRDGRIAEPVRVNVISGSVFSTLAAVEACANDFFLQSGAIGGCGKFDQWPLPVALGGPHVLVAAMDAG